MSPLEAVDRTEVALLSVLEAVQLEELQRAVRIPDVDALFGQLLAVGRAGDEPEQFLGDRLEDHLLGGQQWDGVWRTEEQMISHTNLNHQSKQQSESLFEFVATRLTVSQRVSELGTEQRVSAHIRSVQLLHISIHDLLTLLQVQTLLLVHRHLRFVAGGSNDVVRLGIRLEVRLKIRLKIR